MKATSTGGIKEDGGPFGKVEVSSGTAGNGVPADPT